MRFPTLLVASLVLAAAGASTAQAGTGIIVIHCKNAQDADLLLDSSHTTPKVDVLNGAGTFLATLSPGGTYPLPASGTVKLRFSTGPLGGGTVPFTILTKSGKAHLTGSSRKPRVDNLVGAKVSVAPDGSVIVQ